VCNAPSLRIFQTNYPPLPADVQPHTTYRATEWHNITGGTGLYDTSLVINAAGPSVSTLVQTILRDNTLTVEIRDGDIITADCRTAHDGSCTSYLLPGGLNSVSPWPYRELEDKSLSAYVMRGAPAYQIEFWDTFEEGITWKDGACRVYASDDSTGFQLCVSKYVGGGDQIVAGKCFAVVAEVPEPSVLIYADFSVNLRLASVSRKRYSARNLQLYQGLVRRPVLINLPRRSSSTCHHRRLPAHQ
jgi:hypothetical protein